MRSKKTRILLTFAISMLVVLSLVFASCGGANPFIDPINNWKDTANKSAKDRIDLTVSLSGLGDQVQIPVQIDIDRSYQGNNGNFKVKVKIKEVRSASVIDGAMQNVYDAVSAKHPFKLAEINGNTYYLVYNNLRLQYLEGTTIDLDIKFKLSDDNLKDADEVLSIKPSKTFSESLGNNIKVKNQLGTEYLLKDFLKLPDVVAQTGEQSYSKGQLKSYKLEGMMDYLTSMSLYDLKSINKKTLSKSGSTTISSNDELNDLYEPIKELIRALTTSKVGGLIADLKTNIYKLFGITATNASQREAELQQKVGNYVNYGYLELISYNVVGKGNNAKLMDYKTQQTIKATVDKKEIIGIIKKNIDEDTTIEQEKKNQLKSFIDGFLKNDLEVAFNIKYLSEFNY